jgi:hypothetical protein
LNNETVTISREVYENLLKANAELSQQVKDLTEAIALLRKQRFRSSSEKNKVDGGEQLSFLFNEAEVYEDTAGSADVKEPDLTTVKGYKRSTKRLVNSADLPEDVEIEPVYKRLEGDDLKCPNCGEEMEQIGEDVVRRLKLIPAKAVIEETHIFTYACKKCTVDDENSVIVSNIPKSEITQIDIDSGNVIQTYDLCGEAIGRIKVFGHAFYTVVLNGKSNAASLVKFDLR